MGCIGPWEDSLQCSSFVFIIILVNLHPSRWFAASTTRTGGTSCVYACIIECRLPLWLSLWLLLPLHLAREVCIRRSLSRIASLELRSIGALDRLRCAGIQSQNHLLHENNGTACTMVVYRRLKPILLGPFLWPEGGNGKRNVPQLSIEKKSSSQARTGGMGDPRVARGEQWKLNRRLVVLQINPGPTCGQFL